MVNRTLKIISLSILVLVLAISAKAQNTKGDKPTSTRETRFKKSAKKKKPAKRVRSKRTTSSLRAYKPRKKTRGGERAGRPVSPINTSGPRERSSRNVYPQSGRYVNNSSRTPKDSQRRNTRSAPRVSARSATGRTRNVYPQSGRFVNHSSTARQRPPRTRKIRPRSASQSFTARRSINAWANFPRPKQKREKAYKGDIAGRKIRTKNFETKRPDIIDAPRRVSRLGTPKRKNNYSSGGGYTAPARRPSANVYTKGYRYSSPGTRPRKVQSGVSNKSTLARLNRMQGGPDKRPGRKRKVVPRSASGSFIARRSTNVWAHFPRPKRKGERAVTKDIAGRPLRTRNFETQKPGLIPSVSPYGRRKRVGDRPYSGPAAGKHATATRSGRSWRGDITHRRIRGRNFTSKKRIEGRPLLGAGYRSGTGRGRMNLPIPVKPPGAGGRGVGKYQGDIRSRKGFNNQGEEYTGNIKARRRAQGGGSASGRLWNNNRSPVQGRTPGIGATGVDRYKGNIRGRKGFNNQGEEYTGNIRARRPFKGGGSASGRLWNNNKSPVQGRTPGIGATGIDRYKGNIRSRKGFNNQGEEYTGSIKARRPLKGGGSASGRLWNNNRSPVQGRTPGIGATGIDRYKGNIRSRKGFNNQGEEYTGDIKARRPIKGGGSVSGKLWNNKRLPIAVRPPVSEQGGEYRGNLRSRKGFNNQGEEYTGNLKARRPQKGGGSVSGKLWNNRETPIVVRAPKSEQGGEYTGNIKAKRPAKGGGSVSGKLWNNNETPVDVRVPKSEQGGEYRGKLKQPRYVLNPNAAEGALKKNRPKTTYMTDGLQVRVAQRPYGHRKTAPEGSIPGIKPTKASVSASEYTKVMRQNWKYVRNPNSADEALKMREPGKAFARATDYQGNIKMRKYDLFGRKQGLHPDAQFVKLNKNNVAGEKDMLTNFKLWWSRLFKKNDTQPSHLKYKGGKPRYDKGEQGLWYD